MNGAKVLIGTVKKIYALLTKNNFLSYNFIENCYNFCSVLYK
jgi:hypothetical protein